MSSGAEELSMETAVVLEASAPSTADFEHKLLELDGKKAETDYADDEDLASSASSVSSASSSSSTSSVQPSAPSLAASLAVDSVPSPGSNDRAACEPQSSSSGDAYEPQQQPQPQPQLGLAVDGHVMMVMAPSAQLLDAGFGGAGGGRPRADTVMSEEDENELDADVCGDDYVDGDAQLMTRVRLDPEPASVIDRQLTFDANGAHGAHGYHGAAGHHGSSGGGHGGRGGNGSRGADGIHATDIHVDHTYSPVTSTVTIKDGVTGNMQIIPLAEDETRTPQLVFLTARGGNGGRGGDGGHGGSGGTGHRGRDATRHSSGTNGGPGGNGKWDKKGILDLASGDGGSGADGGTGGDGGDISVTVDERDMDFVMLYSRPDFNGGHGGAKGHGGSGGSGGAGGAGGSSYSWTESHTTSNGDGTSSTYTTHHSNPGGHSGPSGHSGSRGHDGCDGRNGATGSYSIKVTKGNSCQVYHSPYELQSVQYEIQDYNDDGIIEPDDDVRVNFTVTNNGGMPTPVHQFIKLYLQSNTWVQFDVDTDHQKITRSLAVGETYTVRNMRMRVKDIDAPRVGKRLREVARLDYRGLVQRVNRLLPGFRAQVDPFVVQFPVLISAVEGLRTITMDEEAPVTFSVKNISNKAIGYKCGRPVEAYLGIAENYKLLENDMVFRNRKGKARPFLEGLLKKIKHLEPGALTYVSGTMGFNNEDLPAYVHGDLTAYLKLSGMRPDNKDQLRCIQQRLFSVQLAEPYKAKENVDVLLVTNTNTTHEEVKAWERLLANVGLLNVTSWNVSLYEGVSFTYRRLDGGTLIEDLKGKLVIFLNNNYSRGAEDTKEAFTDLPSRELYLLVRDAGIRTYVVGQFISGALQNRILPFPEKTQSEYVSVKEVLTRRREDEGELEAGTSRSKFAKAKRARKLKRAKLLKPKKSKGDDEQTAEDEKQKDEIEEEEADEDDVKEGAWRNAAEVKKYTDGYTFFKPRSRHLERRAKRVAHHLEKHLPNERNVAVYNYDPILIKKSFLRKHYDLGTVEVHRALDRTDTSISSFGRSDADVHKGELIEDSTEHAFHVLKILPFERKLSVAPNIFDQHGDRDSGLIYIDALKKAILADLTDEQVVYRLHKWSGPLPAAKIKNKLTKLQKLCDIKSPVELAALDKGNRFLVELLLDFEVLLKKLPRWYDKIWFCRRQRIVTSTSLDIIAKWLRKCGVVSTPISEVKALRKERQRAEKKTTRDFLMNQFTRPASGVAPGSQYVQDNWLNVAKTMTKADFENRRPQEEAEVVLKEVRSVFNTDEERERAIAKLQRFREGIKKSVQSEDAKVGKGKERI